MSEPPRRTPTAPFPPALPPPPPPDLAGPVVAGLAALALGLAAVAVGWLALV